MSDFTDALKYWDALKPRIEKLIDDRTKQCRRGKLGGTVISVNGDRYDVDFGSPELEIIDVYHNIPNFSNQTIEVGDRVIVDYYYSPNNAFIAIKV